MADESPVQKKEIEALDEKLRKLEERDAERLEELTVEADLDIRARLIARDILDAKKKDNSEKDAPISNSLTSSLISSATGTGGPVFSMPSGVTGTMGKPKAPRLHATSIKMLALEIFASRKNANLLYEAKMGKGGNANTYKRMWAVTQMGKARKEGMIEDLRVIEKRTSWRTTRMNALSHAKAEGSITPDQDLRLQKLQREEISRYWIRQNVVQDMPIHTQQKMNFLRPVGEGAYGVMPFTYLTRFDQLNMNQKKSVKWIYDNVILRFQGQIAGKFLPKVSGTKWFKDKQMGDVESQFDDIDEEIYSEKAFKKLVKKGQAQLEDMEEEISGYDKFTVQEEKDIKKYVSHKVAEMKAREKEQEWY